MCHNAQQIVLIICEYLDHIHHTGRIIITFRLCIYVTNFVTMEIYILLYTKMKERLIKSKYKIVVRH